MKFLGINIDYESYCNSLMSDCAEQNTFRKGSGKIIDDWKLNEVVTLAMCK